MVGTPRILAILAHPGDETWALGAALARYVAEGVRVHLLCATRGESAAFGSSKGVFPGAVLGRMRERELQAAAQALGVHGAEVLGYPDGGLAAVDPFRLQMELAARIRRRRPQVVITWGPQGPGGDADRAAIGEATRGAVLAAARHSAPVPGGESPHAVRKVYHRVWSPRGLEAVVPGGPAERGRDLRGLAKGIVPVPEWMVSAVVSAEEQVDRAWRGLACHRSRPFCPPSTGSVAGPGAVGLLSRAEFVRSLATVGVAGGQEVDLLAGIRTGSGRAVRAA